MFSYNYNLRSLGFSEDEYETIAQRALSLARGASAVDTGKFRKGWTVRIDGDILIVANPVRYAPFVELGSMVHRKHQFKIRNALSSLGLNRGEVSFGSKAKSVETATSSNISSTAGIVTTSGAGSRTPGVIPITEQEIRSPALLLRRVRPDGATNAVPRTQRVPKSALFNRSRLLELIVAAEIANQIINNNEEL